MSKEHRIESQNMDHAHLSRCQKQKKNEPVMQFLLTKTQRERERKRERGPTP